MANEELRLAVTSSDFATLMAERDAAMAEVAKVRKCTKEAEERSLRAIFELETTYESLDAMIVAARALAFEGKTNTDDALAASEGESVDCHELIWAEEKFEALEQILGHARSDAAKLITKAKAAWGDSQEEV